ncbi:MAG: DEAD/DEAH box helicase [Actinobacteria bacterium]|nr:DEAD/DEAH box helicase [Actinomycetota bacterium]
MEDLRASYRSGKKSVCLVLPTGSGKTVVAAAVVKATVARGRRALFVAHRVELLGQSVTKLETAGLTNLRLIRAEHDIGSGDSPVTVASIQTLSTERWADKLPAADLVILDECHRGVAVTYRRIVAAYPDAHILGLTATPQRGDGVGLGEVFDGLVIGPTVRELTDLGHLAPCRVFAPTRTLSAGQLATSVTDAYHMHARAQRAVVFCVDVAHSKAVADELNAAGVVAASIDGDMPDAVRADILRRFRAGEIRVVSNVQIFVEGFDDPGVAVCILARKIGHVGVYLQCVGRILRPAEGKTSATVVDLCGSALEYGAPDLERFYTLEGDGIRTSDRVAVRQCMTCGACYEPTASLACPQCGGTRSKEIKSVTVVGENVVEMSGEDRLRVNLQDAAARTQRSFGWVRKAHAKIVTAKLRWRP